MSDYDTDILLWSERQGDLLRRRAAGALINDTDLDWSNIAEEVESVGRSQLAQVRSLLVQAILHTLKARAWPMSQEVPRWLAEARGFRDDAKDSFSPSMRQRIDVAELYARALRRMPEAIDGQIAVPMPSECWVSLDDLLSEEVLPDDPKAGPMHGES